MGQNSNLRICSALSIQLAHGSCSIRTIHPEDFGTFGSGLTRACAFGNKICWGKEKSVKSFHLEECLYCCWSKLKTFSFSQGRGTMLVLSIPGEVFSFQARIVIKMKKTPQPQELKGTAVVIVPIGRIWTSSGRPKEHLEARDTNLSKWHSPNLASPLPDAVLHWTELYLSNVKVLKYACYLCKSLIWL